MCVQRQDRLGVMLVSDILLHYLRASQVCVYVCLCVCGWGGGCCGQHLCLRVRLFDL